MASALLSASDEPQVNANALRRYWAREVPELFSPHRDCDCLNITYEEELARQKLFVPLENFIYDSDGSNLDECVARLKELDDPPALCGRVFKNGEPTYSCRDCSLDPTCVLCVDCFKNSAHKGHKYKMSTSGGGGYCDCGDKEAWKSDPCCDIHVRGQKASTSAAESEQSVAVCKLPRELATRTEIVMRTALNYCYEVLTWETSLRLPEDLIWKKKGSEADQHSNDDSFATMLFNDETHTYDQVIQTLSRAIECSQKEAIDFATTIDREGRSIVKCSPFPACSQVKNVIERITSRHGSKPLRVEVMHATVIAHQTFAMRLMGWLQNMLGYCEGFRQLFSDIIIRPVERRNQCGSSSSGEHGTIDDRCGPSLVELIMQADVRLWKTARTQWHQLFISGLLMENQSKKAFAKVFTRIYGNLMREFVGDDHDHSLSITSLSVQLYTVPSLAHTLIAEDDALFILLKTFLEECRRHRNHDGKLIFERNHQTIVSFRRAQFILIDLKYLLSTKPTEWTDTLRKSFQHAFITLVELLEWMQGMDPVVRQVGQHVEFEAEWETGINLQLKLAPVLTEMIEWCGTDRIVLLKSLRHALNELVVKTPNMNQVVREVCGHSVADCIDYDVSALPITVHLPLSRLVSGLLLHLTQYDINYNSADFLVRKKPTAIELMELPMRTLVMIAQFRAGMWRRNGYSLVNQVYFYHNVRLRDEMYDRDVLMMQYVAAQLEPNAYIVHLLNKFNLILWAQENYETVNRRPEEDYLRQTITLVEEFLSLVLIIVSERYTPGVGKVKFEDRLKKEIVQWLCVEAMTHSDLLKVLPKETVYDSIIESLINEVAEFKRPAPNQSGGKYEVKTEHYQQFNPFFYHYTRQDQSTAEEVQLRRKKQANEPFICCPPPRPPPLTAQFSSLRNMLNCDVMLHVITLVLRRTLAAYAISFSETQYEKVLHLIGVGLHEEEMLLTDPSCSEDSSADVESFNFTERCTARGIFNLLEDCANCSKVESHKDLLRWLTRKFTEVSKLRGRKIAESQPSSSSSTSSAEECAKRIEERKKNAEIAAQRRARIMQQMMNLQKNFIKEHAEYFEMDVGPSGAASGSMMDLSDEQMEPDDNPVAIGLRQSARITPTEEHTCILCREEQSSVSTSGRCLVLAAFVQRSTVLSKNRDRKVNSSEETVDNLFMPSDLYFGPHVSTCGHMMHSDCWQKFFESVLTKERRRPLRYGRHISFDVDKSEFLCPLCECLSNTVIPILPHMSPTSGIQQSINISDWLNALRAVVEKVQPIWIKDPSMTVESGEKYICRYKANDLAAVAEVLPEALRDIFTGVVKQFETNADEAPKLSAAFLEMMRMLSQSIYTIGLNVHPNPEDDRVPLLSYWSCAFTIHSIERVMRDERKAIFNDLSSRKFNCLQALVRYVAASSGIFNVGIIRSHCTRFLRYLLVNDHHSSCDNCILDIDAFGLLTSLILSSPSLYVREHADDPGCALTLPACNEFDQHYINVVLTLHLVQIILSSEKNCEEPMEIDEGAGQSSSPQQSAESSFIWTLASEILQAAGAETKLGQAAERLVIAYKTALLPFLRCAAMLFHFLTNVPPPSKLKDIKDISGLAPLEEFTVLCQYLSLPSKLNLLFGSIQLRQLALSWTRHPRVNLLLTSKMGKAATPTDLPLKLIAQPHTVNQLVSLPTDYSELINSVSQFTCPNSDSDDSRSPTMCLVCGKMLCSQSYCCQQELEGGNAMVGACTYHTHMCGAGVGVFLRIRDCKILLLAGKSKGCYMPAPYIDEYGETDQGLVRGNPLHLCQASYNELQRLWLRHGIPEQIAHQLEISTNLAATNWPLV